MDFAHIISFMGLVLGSNWLGNILLEVYKDRKTKKTPIERATLALVRKELLSSSKEYIKLQGIPDDEYEMFAELGQAYIAMKGNSKVKKKFEEAMKLPIIEE